MPHTFPDRPPGDALITTADVARMLGVSLRTVETLVASGQLRPVYVTPRCRRFDVAAVDAFARSRVRPAANSTSLPRRISLRRAH